VGVCHYPGSRAFSFSGIYLWSANGKCGLITGELTPMLGVKLKTIKYILIPLLLFLCLDCTNKTMHENQMNCEQSRPGFVTGGALTGARGKTSCMRGIIGSIGNIKQLYNQEYKDNKPDCITVIVTLKINYLGIVTSSEVTKTNSNNPKFDSEILEIINSIKFETIEQKNDVTELVYPFVFTK
jgi:TonB family protein